MHTPQSTGAPQVNSDEHVPMKIFLAWIGTMYGSITLNTLVLLATLVFTMVQVYFTIRDKWWRDPRRVARRNKMRRATDRRQP